MIHDDIVKALTALLINDGTYGNPVLYHAFGHGSGAWGSPPASPASADTSLVDEYFRKSITRSKCRWLVESSGSVTAATDTYSFIDTARTESDSSELINCTIQFTSGPNSGSERIISGYDVTTDSVSVYPAWGTAPGVGETYKIFKVSDTPTGMFEIVTTLTVFDTGSEGIIREHGVFAGDATSTLDSGILIASFRHDPITKTAFNEIVRPVRIEVTV